MFLGLFYENCALRFLEKSWEKNFKKTCFSCFFGLQARKTSWSCKNCLHGSKKTFFRKTMLEQKLHIRQGLLTKFFPADVLTRALKSSESFSGGKNSEKKIGSYKLARTLNEKISASVVETVTG